MIFENNTLNIFVLGLVLYLIFSQLNGYQEEPEKSNNKLTAMEELYKKRKMELEKEENKVMNRINILNNKEGEKIENINVLTKRLDLYKKHLDLIKINHFVKRRHKRYSKKNTIRNRNDLENDNYERVQIESCKLSKIIKNRKEFNDEQKAKKNIMNNKLMKNFKN